MVNVSTNESLIQHVSVNSGFSPSKSVEGLLFALSSLRHQVHGFFKGMSLPLTTISLTSSVVFGTYRNCLQCLSQFRGEASGPNTKLDVFLSGLAGGVAQVTRLQTLTLHVYISCLLTFSIRLRQISVMSPGDIVKVRLQCQTESKLGGANASKPKYRGPVHCLLTIIKEEGFRGLYRGALPLMLRDGPSFATYFLTYTTICEWLTESGKDRPGKTSPLCFSVLFVCLLFKQLA